MDEPNQTSSPAPQTPRMGVNEQEANLIAFTLLGEQQAPPVQVAAGSQEQPKRQRSPGRKKKSE